MSRGLYHESAMTVLHTAETRAPFDWRPNHVASHKHYCPVCGVGCETKKEAGECCVGAMAGEALTEGQLKKAMKRKKGGRFAWPHSRQDKQRAT